MVLPNDFREFLQLLDASGTEYLIVGGYAIALYGHPRYTGDLDIWIKASAANAAHVMHALGEFGFGTLPLSEEDFTREETIVQLGYPPLRIDIITSIDGVTFDSCYERRNLVELDGINVPFIGLEDLKTNKRAAGRHRDLADLEALN